MVPQIEHDIIVDSNTIYKVSITVIAWLIDLFIFWEMFGCTFSSHSYLRGLIILLKKLCLITLSILFFTLLIHVDNSQIWMRREHTTKYFSHFFTRYNFSLNSPDSIY
jgi:hypothetical protein